MITGKTERNIDVLKKILEGHSYTDVGIMFGIKKHYTSMIVKNLVQDILAPYIRTGTPHAFTREKYPYAYYYCYEAYDFDSYKLKRQDYIAEKKFLLDHLDGLLDILKNKDGSKYDRFQYLMLTKTATPPQGLHIYA